MPVIRTTIQYGPFRKVKTFFWAICVIKENMKFMFVIVVNIS